MLRSIWICTAVALVAAAGCGFPQAKLDEAKGAVQEGLETWKKGGKPADLLSLSRPVEFNEVAWSDGLALVAYEVGKTTYSDRDKVVRCEAKLTLRNRKGKQRVENVVYDVKLESPIKVMNNPMP